MARGEGVVVCVVDAFFDTSHPDFVGADVSVGADLTHATLSDFVGDPQKDHGTAMAALIVGQGSGPDRKEGTLGTAPKSKVRWVTVSLEKVPRSLDGIKECADLGADVISVSLGGDGEPEAVAYAQARDAVRGSHPSMSCLRGLTAMFASDRSLVTDELAELRYHASIRPGFQASFAATFPAPRQPGVDGLASSEADIRAIAHETLIIHGRDDQVIPLDNSLTLHHWINRSQLHVFGRCGHWVQIEHNRRFNQLVGAFLTES